MDFDALEPPTNIGRRLVQAGLFLATALIAGAGFAFLADSQSGGEVRMASVTEVPYSAHLDVAPRGDRLPKAQQAAPATALLPSDDAAFAELVNRALAETQVTRAPTVAPTDDFGAAPITPPIPVARPQPPAPAIAQYDEPDHYLVPMEPVPQHEYMAEQYDRRSSARHKSRPIDALGLPFEFVGRTVASLGNAVASIAKPARRY